MQFKNEIKLKILQLSKYYPPINGGIEIVAEFFSRALTELGHEVNVLSFGQSDKFYTGKYHEKVYQSAEHLKLSSSPLSMSYFKKFYKIIKEDPPQILFVHLPNPFAHEIIKFFSALIKEKKVKVVGVYHSDIVNQVHFRDAYGFYFSRHIHLYDQIICSSLELKSSSAILSSLTLDKVKVFPFCVQGQYQSIPKNSGTDFKGKFLAVGRMVPYKGYDFLIDTFKSLPYGLTIIGTGPLNDSLRKKAGPNINFVGEVSEEEKYQHFKDSDALIMSSINRAEAYGMTIVEAFSVGLPVIASNIDTGVSFLVKDAVTGLKFSVLNQEELTSQIKRLSSDSKLRNELSVNSFNFFKAELNFDAFKGNINYFVTSI